MSIRSNALGIAALCILVSLLVAGVVAWGHQILHTEQEHTIQPSDPYSGDDLMHSKLCQHRALVDGVTIFDSHGEYVGDVRRGMGFVVWSHRSNAGRDERVFIDQRAALDAIAPTMAFECRPGFWNPRTPST